MREKNTRKSPRSDETVRKTTEDDNYRSICHNSYFDTGRLDTRHPGPGEIPCRELRFVFREQEIMMPQRAGSVSFVTGEGTPVPPYNSRVYIGMLDEMPCYALSVSPLQKPPEGYVFCDLRSISGRVEDEILGMPGGRASQIIRSDLNTMFCGRCGTRTELKKTELARECPKCGTYIPAFHRR